jgi:hypothetical protein
MLVDGRRFVLSISESWARGCREQQERAGPLRFKAYGYSHQFPRSGKGHPLPLTGAHRPSICSRCAPPGPSPIRHRRRTGGTRQSFRQALCAIVRRKNLDTDHRRHDDNASLGPLFHQAHVGYSEVRGLHLHAHAAHHHHVPFLLVGIEVSRQFDL